MRTTNAPAQVMVIEDCQAYRDAICAMLVFEGYHPVPCRSAETAWTALSAGLRPSVILVDLALSGMSGREFLRLLRSVYWGDAIPVLLLSGWHRLEEFAETPTACFPRTPKRFRSCVPSTASSREVAIVAAAISGRWPPTTGVPLRTHLLIEGCATGDLSLFSRTARARGKQRGSEPGAGDGQACGAIGRARRWR